MLDHAGSGEMGAKMGAKCASVLTTRPAFTSSSPAGCGVKKFDSGRDGVLVIPVEPQTLRRWHRALLERARRGRRRRPGRPPLAAEPRSLIARLARENPRWGYMRIQGELLKLGIGVSHTTIATVLRSSGLGPAPRRIGPTWSEFLRAQAHSMLGGGLRDSLDGDASSRAVGPRIERPARWKPTT